MLDLPVPRADDVLARHLVWVRSVTHGVVDGADAVRLAEKVERSAMALSLAVRAFLREFQALRSMVRVGENSYYTIFEQWLRPKAAEELMQALELTTGKDGEWSVGEDGWPAWTFMNYTVRWPLQAFATAYPEIANSLSRPLTPESTGQADSPT